MKENNLVINYYNKLIKGALKGEINYSVETSSEGFHDCILIDFLGKQHNITIDENTYFPSFIIFYKYIEENGDYISVKSDEIEDLYSFTSDGYGTGFYINKENVDNKEMFSDIIKLLKLKGFDVH